MATLFDYGEGVFTIPPGVSFMPAFLEGLEAVQDEMRIGPEDMTVFLPTRRAIRTFQQHITERHEGRTSLLPTLRALGDLDEDDLALASLAHLEEDLSLLPAIAPLKRLFLLQQALKDQPGIREIGPMSTQQRLLLARELAKLLDQMQNEGTNFKDLSNLQLEKELAQHWDGILRFLGAMTKKWPETLKQKGLIDLVQRRTNLIETLIKTWQKNPPTGPVFAAGSTGSVPVIRRLLKAISLLPQGAVIFPGLDREMDLDAWDALEETHPQFMMKQTLAAFKLSRDKVKDWPYPGRHSPRQPRLEFVRDAMLPAAVTGRWHGKRQDPKTLKTIIRGLNIIECPTPREEAGVIALIMREALEDENKKTALITPDRALARRVKAELKRWDIEVDDSAGTPLLLTPPGTFFSLSLDMVAEKFSPVLTLALLKHPLSHVGFAWEKLLKFAGALDQKPLRGARPAPGIKGLINAVEAELKLPGKKDLVRFLKTLQQITGDLAKLVQREKISFARLLRAHIKMAIALSNEMKGDVALWRGESGQHLSKFLTDLQDQADALGDVAGSEYPALIEALLQEKVVKPHLQTHPRLAILGTLEARLQNYDLVILGSLNEGSWPPEPAADPWMSREMRKTAGLPTPDQRVGQSAHDFYMALGSGEVVLTRAGKASGSPTTPSRWLQRMTALLGKPDLTRETRQWLSWFQTLDMAEENVEISPPQPKPEFSLRPRKLSVTNIELLMRDPYAVFAKHILKLRPLDDLDADPSAADKGTILHEIFDTFLKQVSGPLPNNALELLLEVGEKAFDQQALTRPMVRVFWWPRFKLAAKAFIVEQKKRAATHVTLATEVEASWLVANTTHPFRVTAKADRIDQIRGDKSAVIIDYKTGITFKKVEEITTGRKPQLALEGVMAGAGAFEGIAATAVSALEYWKLGEAAEPLRITFPPKIDIALTIEEAETGIRALVDYFDDQTVPYLATPDPEFPSYGEYDLLARTAEWQNRLKNKGQEGA